MSNGHRPIRLRNAITELWNAGQSVATIASLNGLSEKRVRALLESARQGHHTPEQLAEAVANQDAQTAAKASQTPRKRRSPRK